ncbi:hypothetical protein AB0G55_00935 [Streptomyces toyocaensis]|uniref:hypothetical protein n=1 Tax=Streptomyces toyocaensis TaxID=55952 RepID=UPI000A483D60|nr:hypothetical protein [Streptomyces toyocaensis]
MRATSCRPAPARAATGGEDAPRRAAGADDLALWTEKRMTDVLAARQAYDEARTP